MWAVRYLREPWRQVGSGDGAAGRTRRHGRRGIARWAALGVIVAILTVATGPAAQADPIQNLNNVPDDLQQFVPNSPAWSASPWMLSPTCENQGGDFGIWARNVIDDTPQLLAYFQSSMFGAQQQPQDKARNDEIIQGFQTLARNIGSILPSGTYCVDQVRGWTGADPTVPPFGFPWGLDTSAGHQTDYYCTDLPPNTPPSAVYNKYFGAERAPCTGFYLSCQHASQADIAKCEAWNTFSDEYVSDVNDMRGKAINDHPATGQASTYKITDLSLPAEEAADSWFTDLTNTISTAAITMLADSMTWWTTSNHTSMLQSPAISQIQNLLRYVGIALLLGSIIWQGIQMIWRRKLDPLVSTATGLLKFVGWSTLGGTIAVLINEGGLALANQVLGQSINKFTQTVGFAMATQTIGATGAIFLLAIVMFFLSCIQWALGFFRMGALVILLALLPTAASGQINEATKPWLPKVLSWCLSLLLYQPIAAIVFSIGFELIGNGTDLSTVLIGMAVLALAVISMPTMLRFFNWGGQQLVSGGGGGGGMAAVGAASSMASGAGGFTRFMDQNGPGSKGGNDSGAMPVTPAHAGDGPGGSDSGSDPQQSGSATGPAGNPKQPNAGVSSAANGTGATGAGAGAEVGSAAGAGSTAVGAGGAAAGTAAAAGPAGAAVAGAQVAKEAGDKAVNAAAGAMTDGAGE
jgi:hypothetical protein